jgi:hypothetical protein
MATSFRPTAPEHGAVACVSRCGAMNPWEPAGIDDGWQYERIDFLTSVELWRN